MCDLHGYHCGKKPEEHCGVGEEQAANSAPTTTRPAAPERGGQQVRTHAPGHAAHSASEHSGKDDEDAIAGGRLGTSGVRK